MPRDYKKEYANYQGKPEQIANRADRNSARRQMEKKGVVSKEVSPLRRETMNDALKAIAVEAGAPEEVLNTLWFSIFCQKFAHLIIEELEKNCEQE